ncbi:MAG: AbrB family transcriptional regulator [Thermoprotei archaeon]|nr:MAG: AbrB family transcriptional regulator [Thermoprotei archaeon]
MVRKVKVYRGGVIKLPSEVRRVAGVEEGDELLVYVEEGRIVLIPPGTSDPVEQLSSTLGEEVDEEEFLERAAREFREVLSRSRKRV